MACIRPKDITSEDMDKTVIYTLSCDGDIRYVGKTKSIGTMVCRYKNHLYHKDQRGKNIYKSVWINECRKLGKAVDMEVLEMCERDVWGDREAYWIEQLRAWGYKLTNIAPGGKNFAYSSIKHFNRLGKEQKERIVKTTEAERQQIFEIAQDGDLTYAEIGRMFGITASSVSSILSIRGYVFKPSERRIMDRIRIAKENGKKLIGRKSSKETIAKRIQTCKDRCVDFGSKLQQDDLDDIKSMFLMGKSLKSIAKKHGVHPKTVRYRVDRMGLSRVVEPQSKIPFEMFDDIVRRVDGGESYNKISKDYDCSHGLVRYVYLKTKNKKQ